jgi:hypothetical protein
MPKNGAVVTVALGDGRLELPEPFASLIVRLPIPRRNGITEQIRGRWLFPSTRAGDHIAPSTLGERMRAIGIHARPMRLAAIDQLASEVPPAIFASLLGFSPKTAAKWTTRAGGNWPAYAAHASRDPAGGHRAPGRDPS